MGMLLPTMMFTGFMFPLENMPMPLQYIANAIPSKWYYIIVKSVMIKGLGIASVWKETAHSHRHDFISISSEYQKI
jgi:ABC-2 type transport system permease protein